MWRSVPRPRRRRHVTCWCRATSWTRRPVATGLLLLRGGRLVADTTPAELLARTGAPTDAETAFLTLIESAEATRVNPRLTLATAGRVLRPDPRGPPHGRADAGRAVRADGPAGVGVHGTRPMIFDTGRAGPARRVPVRGDVRRHQHRDACASGPAEPWNGCSRRRSGKADFMVGYALAFAVSGRCCRAVIATRPSRSTCADWTSPDLVWMLIVAMAVLDAVLGTALGLLASAFAHTEFQAVQFMPAFVLPQFLLVRAARCRAPSLAGVRCAGSPTVLAVVVCRGCHVCRRHQDRPLRRCRHGPADHRRLDRGEPGAWVVDAAPSLGVTSRSITR
jgi:hypothetical protein